jgi:hypothetical protein
MAPSEVPDIPHCSVERGDDEMLHVTHESTGTTMTADTEERAVIAGMLLRRTTEWRRQWGEIPFRTGDLP